jgi:signal transduction histidine kinase
VSGDELGAAKRLVALIAHELRAPIAAVEGAATTLRRRGADLSEEDHDRLLALIADESARAARLAGDLLSTALLEEGRLDVRIEPCDAASVAASVVGSARQHLPASVGLDLAAPPGLPAVAADPDRLRQVLANLVENALRHSPPGESVRAAIEQREQWIRFSVGDAGPGIAPDDQQRIFERFYQGGQAGAGRGGAAGLGLSIARELVERMDGRIWAESPEGGGAMVVVELPAAGRGAAA